MIDMLAKREEIQVEEVEDDAAYSLRTRSANADHYLLLGREPHSAIPPTK